MSKLATKIANQLHRISSPNKERSSAADLLQEEIDAFGEGQGHSSKPQNGRQLRQKLEKEKKTADSRKSEKLSTGKAKTKVPTIIDDEDNSQTTISQDQSIDTDPMQCSKCRSLRNSNLTECEVCAFWFCGKCTHLKQDALKALHACKGIHWYCDGCEASAVGAVTNMKYKLGKRSPEEFLNQKIIDQIDMAFTAFESKIRNSATVVEETMKKSYADVVKKLDEKVEAQVVIARPTALDAQPNSDAHLRELQDRQERRENLIIFGIPESESENRDSRKTHDEVHFQTICQDGMDIEVEILHSTRLGAKKGGGQARPLRVKLRDERMKMNILRNAKNLARSDDQLLTQVYIKKDMTFTERQEDRKLRDELRARREEIRQNGGDAHWIIRRGKVVNTTRPGRQTETPPIDIELAAKQPQLTAGKQ